MAAHEQLNILQSAMYGVSDFARLMYPITRAQPKRSIFEISIGMNIKP
ncbi:hypothetical protein [Pseudomonas sp. MPB23]